MKTCYSQKLSVKKKMFKRLFNNVEHYSTMYKAYYFIEIKCFTLIKRFFVKFHPAYFEKITFYVVHC